MKVVTLQFSHHLPFPDCAVWCWYYIGLWGQRGLKNVCKPTAIPLLRSSQRPQRTAVPLCLTHCELQRENGWMSVFAAILTLISSLQDTTNQVPNLLPQSNQAACHLGPDWKGLSVWRGEEGVFGSLGRMTQSLMRADSSVIYSGALLYQSPGFIFA